MTVKNIKEEARKKLALNMHQAIVIYTVEFVIFVTLIALIVMSCVSLGVNTPAAIVMVCYGIMLCIVAVVASGMVNFALVDFYLATYRCKPYNIRRLGDTIARSNITKVLLISLKRTLLAFLLLLCLIVPGVIYLIRTSMANYLLISNPKMKASTALSASNKVMSGKTGAYFSLCMSLIGWYILGVVTLGLGFIFILPYTNLVKTVFYKRNLQGDKNVYNTVVQPVSVPYAMSTPGQPMNEQGQSAQDPAATVIAQPSATPQSASGPAPIDTLADEDFMDMKEAMRDFDNAAKIRQQPDIPEIPISPVTAAKVVEAEPIRQQSVANEPIVQNTDNSAADIVPPVNNIARPAQDENSEKVREIDGTDLVETERVLSAEEIKMSADARKRMFDSNEPSSKLPPDRNFMSTSSKQSPNDFVTAEVNTEFNDTNRPISAQETVVPDSSTPNAEQSSSYEEPIISDSEFEEFLRNFDGVPKQESTFKPLKRSERANTIREERERRERPSSLHTPENDTRRDPTDRAERMRREREERLNLNNKK